MHLNACKMKEQRRKMKAKLRQLELHTSNIARAQIANDDSQNTPITLTTLTTPTTPTTPITPTTLTTPTTPTSPTTPTTPTTPTIKKCHRTNVRWHTLFILDIILRFQQLITC